MKIAEIDELRKVMGTLPSTTPKKITVLIRGCEKVKVDLLDTNINPYKSIVAASTATWGDDLYLNKWTQLTPQNRFIVVLAAITGNVLPQALESVTFTFSVKNVPRHCFDQHARARIGTAFYSIGSRDNNKLDASFILYTKLYDKVMKNPQLYKQITEIKDIYESILDDGKGSWQIARAVLPMCYHHPYHFSSNYLALQGQSANRMKFCEEEFICAVFWCIREEVKKKFPLLAEYLRPGCDKSKSCQYSKLYTLSNVFGCLFAGCGRWPANTQYSTFNESCTDVIELEKQLKFHINRPTEWFNYDENSYELLSDIDKKLFEES